ncbi:MAG: preprotein translocase subunit SecG [Tuberibacillus sp.]
MLHTILVTLIIIAAIGIIAVVLLQSGKSEGLGAISGGAEQLFGKQKARGIDRVLLQFTIVCAVVFFVCALILAFFVS